MRQILKFLVEDVTFFKFKIFKVLIETKFKNFKMSFITEMSYFISIIANPQSLIIGD